LDGGDSKKEAALIRPVEEFTMNEKSKTDLMNIVGPESYTDALMDLISYSSDASEHQHRPDCAVWPRTTEQVSSILKLANRDLFPVIPRGAGTGFAGSVAPQHGGVVMDMGRMNRILRISIEDRLVVLQPGVVYAQLAKTLAPYGFFFPPDPASGKAATLGGNVATGAGGLKGAKYGTTRDYVLALEVVLPDGSVLRTGSNCMKSVSGYDLTRLFVGSEGTLGVVTEITLKVNPKPLTASTCSASFDTIEDAGKATSEVMRSGILPSALEILDDQCILALNQAAGLGLPEAAAMVFAEADGCTQEETSFQIDKIISVFKRNNAKRIEQAQSAADAERIWTARKSVGGILFRLSYNMLAEDVTVPISKVSEMLKGIKAISKRHNILIATLGHLGDGNLHPNIIFNGTDPEERRRAEAATADLFKLAIDMGGTLTGEHGIGLAKAPFMRLEYSEVAMRVMSSLKKLFDPNNILNPGKMALEV
jgi:glycolate oxidase